MSEVHANSPISINGPFQTKQEHPIKGDFLRTALDSLVAIGDRIAYDVIMDDSVRRQYKRHIQMIVDEVRAEVANGEMTALEGGRYCNQLRDRLFVEYRQCTSAQGVAYAETLKLKARGFDYYLNRYAGQIYKGRKFVELSVDERAAVYYEVMKSSTRDNKDVTAKSARLVKYAKGMLLITGVVSVWEITKAKDHVKEAARQGNIIAAGMIGGGIAGGAVSFLCGPAEPVCAFATVAIGANLGSAAGEAITEQWDEALQFFRSFVKN